MSTHSIKTPNAAIIIWNYNERLGLDDTSPSAEITDASLEVIDLVSILQIQTSKSKSQPNGSFNFILAPTANWVELITPGSWCCLLMTNTPITVEDLKNSNRFQVKMVGKIETVRADVNVEDGTRRTTYNVSGIDWGHIFQSALYIDSLVASANDPGLQGNAIAVAIRKALFATTDGSPKSFAVKDNLKSLINIFGQGLDGLDKAGAAINRLAKSVYDFRMPTPMGDFFKFLNDSDARDIRINKILKLQTGRLVDVNKYDSTPEAFGYLDPFSLQGTNTFWQILMENSNPAMNEMFCEMSWGNDPTIIDQADLVLYNRIKPFSFKKSNFAKPPTITSMFQNLRTHKIEDGGDIDPVDVMYVNAGTNWRDKFNFIEIKPQFQDFNVISNWTKQKSQLSDQGAFQREGFRPLMVGTKQFPVSGDKEPSDVNVDMAQLSLWTQALKEWYFNTHTMLNGTIVLHGVDDYVAVGENIRFSADFLSPTPNMNSATVSKRKNGFVLAHIENVSHSFASVDGARTYTTTIQFVRGILVDSGNNLLGDGALDKTADKVDIDKSTSHSNTVTTVDEIARQTIQRAKGR